MYLKKLFSYNLNKNVVCFLLILSVSTLSSFRTPVSAYVTYGNGHGTVVDNYGNPVENVKILIYDSSDELVDTEYTRSDGFFRLALNAGTFDVIFDRPGYVGYEATIFLPDSEKSYNINNDPVKLGTIQMSHTLGVLTQVLSRVEAPGSKVLFPFTISNIGEDVETPEFIVESPDGWQTRVLDSSGEISQVQFEAGSMQLTLEVTIPKASFTEENITLNVVGYTTQSYIFKVKSVTQPENSIEISSDYPSVSMKQGESMSIPITVSNNGQLSETLNLIGNLPLRWEADFTVGQTKILSINLDPQESEVITVEVTPADSTPAGNYQLEICALSEEEVIRSSLNITINVEDPNYNVRLHSSYRVLSVETGNIITYPVTVTNLGDSDSLFMLSVLTSPEGWGTAFKSGEVKVSDIFIASGASVGLEFEITPSSIQNEDSYEIEIHVESEDNSTSDSLNLTVNLVEPSSEVDVSSVFTDITVKAGSSITYPLKIWNKGSRDTQIKIDVEFSPPNWDTTFTSEGVEVSSFLLKAGEQTTVNLAVKPPKSVDVGDYTIKVRIETSEGIIEDIDLMSKVTGSYAIDLDLSTMYKTLSIGESVNFVAVIQNPGNSPLTTVYLDIEAPNDWEVTITPSQVTTLNQRESAPFDIVVKTPADTVAGDYLVSVKAVSDQGESGVLDLRITAQASNTWGYIGYGIAAIFLIGLGLIYRKFKRR